MAEPHAARLPEGDPRPGLASIVFVRRDDLHGWRTARRHLRNDFRRRPASGSDRRPWALKRLVAVLLRLADARTQSPEGEAPIEVEASQSDLAIMAKRTNGGLR